MPRHFLWSYPELSILSTNVKSHFICGKITSFADAPECGSAGHALVCGSTRLIHSYFDNVMAKFMINNSADACLKNRRQFVLKIDNLVPWRSLSPPLSLIYIVYERITKD